MSRSPCQHSRSASYLYITATPLGLSNNVCAAFVCPDFLPRSVPGPLPIYCPTMYLSFVGYSNWKKGPGSKGNPLLCSVVIRR